MDWAERARLVAALREHGVDYLAPSDARGEPLDDRALVKALAEHEDPRLRQALIALFLVQPQLAPLAASLRPMLPEPAATELVAHYMAAVYLQSIWMIRLGHYQSPVVPLVDYFSQQLDLPHPEEMFGELGLRALAAWHTAHRAERGNPLSEYEGVFELIIDRIRSRARRRAVPSEFEMNFNALASQWRSAGGNP
jgi:hypothetical protein